MKVAHVRHARMRLLDQIAAERFSGFMRIC
jgi:hypothetical protein